VVEALIATQPLHAVCRALLERWGSRWRQHRTDGRARRRAARLLNDTIVRYETLLLSIDHFPVPLGDTASSARSLMTGYGLASYDAIHAASAVAAGAEAIVTLDTGFALLPTSLLTLYTDRSRLASCRAKRPR
jgi:predicted nucleic acid-binding protein